MPKRVDYLKMYVGYQNNNQLDFQKHDRHWVIEIESPTELFVRGGGNLGHMTILFSDTLFDSSGNAARESIDISKSDRLNHFKPFL